MSNRVRGWTLCSLLIFLGCGSGDDENTQSPDNSQSQTANQNSGGAAQNALNQMMGKQNGEAAGGQRGGSPIADVAAKIVDYQQVKNHPDIVVVENRAQGQDPISFAASAYVSLRTKAQALAFQHQLKLQKELNGGNWPSHQQFVQTAKQMRVEYEKMPPYRLYGYDPQTGQILVLEDKKLKKQIYDEKGIPWDE